MDRTLRKNIGCFISVRDSDHSFHTVPMKKINIDLGGSNYSIMRRGGRPNRRENRMDRSKSKDDALFGADVENA